jgi:hypothetical protein
LTDLGGLHHLEQWFQVQVTDAPRAAIEMASFGLHRRVTIFGLKNREPGRDAARRNDCYAFEKIPNQDAHTISSGEERRASQSAISRTRTPDFLRGRADIQIPAWRAAARRA